MNYPTSDQHQVVSSNYDQRLRKAQFLTLSCAFLCTFLYQLKSFGRTNSGMFISIQNDIQNDERYRQNERHTSRILSFSGFEDLEDINNNNSGSLSEDTHDDSPIDPHNKICRDYLKKFLEGTTDEKDECEGLENAYSAADCSEDVNGIIYIDGHHRALQNETDTDDTVPTIDDFYQEFQCCKVISHYYAGRCLYHQQFASLSLLGIVSVLILCGLVKTLLQAFDLHWMPEAGGCIIVGAICGAIMTMEFPQYQKTIGTFNDDLFLFILLPPIIFNASLAIDKKKFRVLLFPIVMFAIVGTFMSAVITGFAVHYLTRVAGSLTTTIPFLDSLIYGALISSVDPVATLSILHSMGVSNTDMLYVIVFGESILNDGVSIAMFESLIMHLDGTEKSLDRDLILSSLLYFFNISWISIAVGAVTGIFCTFYFWGLRGRHGPVAEVATFFCFALLAYYIGDGVGGSGIVSIMVAGFLMDIFVRGTHMTERDIAHELIPEENLPDQPIRRDDNMEEGAGHPIPTKFRFPSYTDFRVMFSGVGHVSNRAKIHVGFVADVIANIMETAIFAYLGLFFFSNRKWDDIPLVLIGVVACVASRALMVGVISLIINGCTSAQDFFSSKLSNDAADPQPLEAQLPRTYVDRNMQIVLLYSGVRGAVSLALAENTPLYDAVTKHGSKFKPALKAMTSSSIIFTVFVFGSSTYYTLKKRRQQNSQEEDRRSLMTALLENNTLELQQNRTDPPWMNENEQSEL